MRREVAQRGPQLSIGFVPTMGALHEGHAHLVRRAREENDLVIVSIFVNPLQFGPNEDFERYPSDLPGDLELLGGLGVDLVFAPGLEDMYPGGDPLVTVSSGRLGTVLDGASRPGHFDGVVTVVNKLLTLASGRTDWPLRAYFGQKDAQQLLIVQRMVRDTNLDVEIRPVPIVRAPDGLALSSRNAYLDDDERRAGLVLSRTLGELARGEIELLEARRRIDEEPIADGRTVELDYLVVVDPQTLAEIPPRPGALSLVAARVGTTRLIDNREIEAAHRP
ncbi:pantoate--beta-alanine ligase [Kocuria sp. p3-SID1433]|nr:pantoate--beta-alanine ligase [Kocuria sp. p3-SID1433]